MNYAIKNGIDIKDNDFIDIDYRTSYIGEEYNIPRYRVIKTFFRNYELNPIRENRKAAQEYYASCYNIETLEDEEDIYRYLSNPNNILIAILYGDVKVYHMYCLDREKMSLRAMNNHKFRYNYMGKDYVKFLPKFWTSEKGFQALLDSRYSIYVFKFEEFMDKLVGIDTDYDTISPGQVEKLGRFFQFEKAWDLLYIKDVLFGL